LKYYCIHEKETEVFKNLAGNRSENNFIRLQNNYIGHSNWFARILKLFAALLIINYLDDPTKLFSDP